MEQGNKRKRGGAQRERDMEYKQKLVDLRRVTRTVAGGKRMRFRATLVIGDQKGKIGYGIEKGMDVAEAITKAFARAKKNLIIVPLDPKNKSIFYNVDAKYKASKIIIKPARVGHGLIAGGPVRLILNLLGVQNVTAKILGGKNKMNNVKATFAALSKFVA